MSSSLEIMTTAMQPLIVFPFSFDISEMARSCTWLSKPTDMKCLLGWLMQNHSGRGEARLIFTAVLLFNEVCGGDCLGVWKTHLWWVWGARLPSGNISAEPPWSTRKKKLLKCKSYSKAVDANWCSGNINFLTPSSSNMAAWSQLQTALL